MKTKVTFKSMGQNVVGNLFEPDSPSNEKRPAILCLTPAGGVKEQVAGLYAKELCQQGYVTLAIDHRTFGESEGEPRNYESSANKIEDIANAVSYLSTLPQVDEQRIGAMGICGGGGYLCSRAVADRRIKAVATVSAYMNHSGFFMMLGSERVMEMVKGANMARQKYFEEGYMETTKLIAPDVDENSNNFQRQIYDYYRTSRAGLETCPNYDPEMALIGIEQAITYNCIPLAPLLSPTPYLGIIGEKAFTAPDTIDFYTAANEPKELFKIEGATHIDLYDKMIFVNQAVAKMTEFYGKYL